MTCRIRIRDHYILRSLSPQRQSIDAVGSCPWRAPLDTLRKSWPTQSSKHHISYREHLSRFVNCDVKTPATNSTKTYQHVLTSTNIY